MPPGFQRGGKTPIPGRRRALRIPIHAVEREEAARRGGRLFAHRSGGKFVRRFRYFQSRPGSGSRGEHSLHRGHNLRDAFSWARTRIRNTRAFTQAGVRLRRCGNQMKHGEGWVHTLFRGTAFRAF